MPRLTAAQVKQEASRRTDKVRSLPDGQGLVLKVEPAGKAYWVQRIFRGGKETMRGIGPYPKVSLLDARRVTKNFPMEPCLSLAEIRTLLDHLSARYKAGEIEHSMAEIARRAGISRQTLYAVRRDERSRYPC